MASGIVPSKPDPLLADQNKSRCAIFNHVCPPGSGVFVVLDDGRIIVSEVKWRASVNINGLAMVGLTHTSGQYLLDRVFPVNGASTLGFSITI